MQKALMLTQPPLHIGGGNRDFYDAEAAELESAAQRAITSRGKSNCVNISRRGPSVVRRSVRKESGMTAKL